MKIKIIPETDMPCWDSVSYEYESDIIPCVGDYFFVPIKETKRMAEEAKEKWYNYPDWLYGSLWKDYNSDKIDRKTEIDWDIYNDGDLSFDDMIFVKIRHFFPEHNLVVLTLNAG